MTDSIQVSAAARGYDPYDSTATRNARMDTFDLYGEEEIARAQFDLDHHPDFSTYWESRAGQDALSLALDCHLKAQTTSEFRRNWHREQMRAAREIA